jgi:hypothetical protein
MGLGHSGPFSKRQSMTIIDRLLRACATGHFASGGPIPPLLANSFWVACPIALLRQSDALDALPSSRVVTLADVSVSARFTREEALQSKQSRPFARDLFHERPHCLESRLPDLRRFSKGSRSALNGSGPHHIAQRANVS